MPWPVSATNSSTASDRASSARRRGVVRASAHRLLGVQHEVEQRLLQLAAVDEHGRQAGLELGLQLDAVQAELVGAQRQHAVHDVGDVLRRARAVCRRANASRLRTILAARSDSSAMRRRSWPTSAVGRAGSPDRSSLSSSCA